MCKLFYKYAAHNKAKTLEEDIYKMIEILTKYEKWNTDIDITTREHDYIVNSGYSRVTRGDKTVYDMFFENIHIHASISKSEEIYSIRLKNGDDNWVCPMNKELQVVDCSHPLNHYYEVYIWYSVPVLDITRTTDYVYKEGTWDKYVYKKMKEAYNTVMAMTDESLIREYYK